MLSLETDLSFMVDRSSNDSIEAVRLIIQEAGVKVCQCYFHHLRVLVWPACQPVVLNFTTVTANIFI